MKEEIRELMDLKGWTQADLAVKFGVSESTAFRWYEGRSLPIPRFQQEIRELLEAARKKGAKLAKTA